MAVLFVARPLMALVTVVYFLVVAVVMYVWVLRRAVAAGKDNRNYSVRSVRLVSEMVHSLKEITLRDKAAGGWDSLAQGVPSFRRMGVAKGEENAACRERAKAVLEQAKKALKEIEALGLDCGIIGRVTEKREKKIYVLK